MPRKTILTVFFTFFCIHLLIFSAFAENASETIYTLDNGMTVILKESHGSPMVASMVFVKSGSKYESQYENGITHFLEHLLFDGTTNLTREELDRSVRDLGGYINAFTRKEMTAYLVLLPKQFIDYGMTVQVDMLFNSTIPDQELPKERKVVIEEINRDKDSPGYFSEKFFTEKAYAGTPYNRPVLGYKAFIENIPREAVISYWKKYYRPENMTLLIIGDFATEEMKEDVANIFGSIDLPPYEIDTTVIIDNSTPTYQPADAAVYDTVATVQSTYVNFSVAGPHYEDSLYLGFDLLAQYLNMDDISPLKSALLSGDNPLATEASVYLSTYEEFTRMEISVVASQPEHGQKIADIIDSQLKQIADHNADTEALDGIKTSVKTDYIYNAEKLHYLGFIIGPTMMTCGWDFVQTYPDKLQTVTWADCQSAAQTWLNDPKYIATVISPTEDTAAAYQPYEMSSEEVTEFFSNNPYEWKNTDSADVPLTYPATDKIDFELTDKAAYFDTTYSNGLTVIIKSRPDSKVFGMNIIGKNRSANEPDMQAGITDFVNRCLEKGTYTRNAAELSRDLAKIGANVTLYDNPWIPYDDRYTSRSYSFMKFETIDEFAERGFHLFADMVQFPSFDSTEVENVRRSMMGVLGRNSASPKEVARNQFYATLFEDKELAKPIMGTPRTIGMITPDNLREYHRKFYAPSNMILTLVSSRPVEQLKTWINYRFGSFNYAATEDITPSEPELFFEIKNVHEPLDKEQVSIYLGGSLPGADSPDLPALKVANSILSSRLYLNLREKQGLAYSVGSGIRFDRKFGWYYAVIGTQANNYREAVDGIILQIEKLKLDGPTEEEIKTAKNQLWGRLMSAKLSSINQAYYLGLDTFLGHSIDYDQTLLNKLGEIDRVEIQRVASKYFRTDAYILSSAGKI